MKKLYLHIGTEKTGTTSIQSFLDKNRGVLSDNGFHLLACGGKKNQRAIPSYCMADDHYDDYFLEHQIDNIEKKQKFRKKIYEDFNEEMNSLDGSVHSVIISSEHFHSRLKSNAEVERFKQLISDYFSEIEIICYLREQCSLVSSSYSTAILAGSNKDFTSFLRYCSPDNSYYNYDFLLKRWSDVFSPECLNVRILSKGELYNNSLIDDFCMAINERLLSFTDKQINVENQSLSSLGLRIGRAINCKHPRYGLVGVNKVRAAVMTMLLKSFSGGGVQVSLEQQQQIQALFKESNQKVADEYFKGRDVLFPVQPLPAENSTIVESEYEVLADLIYDLKSGSLLLGKKVDLLRDAAILLESTDLNKAYELMKLAQQGRPEGAFIKSKITQYEAAFDSIDSTAGEIQLLVKKFKSRVLAAFKK